MALTLLPLLTSFVEQTSKSFYIKFRPVLTGADDDVLLESEYKFKVNKTTGYIDDREDKLIHLPVKASGTIRYNFEFPSWVNQSIGYFHLSNAATDLSEVITGGQEASDTVIDYIDQKMSDYSDLEVYADNAAALLGGLSAGAPYRTATGDFKIVY